MIFVVVTYDIADDRRRLKVMKMLEGYGEHVQESVFDCHLDRAAYREMVGRLRQLIHAEADNIRLYHLCAADVARIKSFGLAGPVRLDRGYEIV